MKSFYGEIELEVLGEVYKPAEDTFLIADNLEVEREEDVLELGTGCGLLSILAAKRGGSVISTDISEKALECARENAISLDVHGDIDFRLGDLFDPLENEKFDLIIFNPPYLPVPENESRKSDLERAWDGGPDGREILDRFLDEVTKYLKPEGRLLFVQSSLTGYEKTLQKLEKNFEVEIKTQKLSFERLYLFSARLINFDIKESPS